MTNKYEIVITDKAGSSSDIAPPVASVPNAETGYAPPTASTGTASGNVGRYIASTTIRPLITAGIDLATSTVELSTGSRRLQDQVNMAKNGVNLLTGAAQSFMGGMAVAGVAGGIAGIAIFGLMQTIGIVTQQITWNMQKSVEDQELAIARDRAGIQYNGGR